MTRIQAAVAFLDGYNQRFGDLTLRECRLALGMSLRDVEAELGFSRATLSRIERGLEAPTLTHMLSLSDHYGVPLDSWKPRMIWITDARPYGLEEDAHAPDTEAGVV